MNISFVKKEKKKKKTIYYDMKINKVSLNAKVFLQGKLKKYCD